MAATGGLYLMKDIKTEILIGAPAEKVWCILTDFDRHPAWNPFIQSISGDKQENGKLVVHIKPPGGGGMTFKPRVLVYKTEREFRWKGKLFFTGLFDGEHYFILEAVNAHTTRFIHGERFSGILVGVSGNMLEKTREGFELMNQALKNECERI